MPVRIALVLIVLLTAAGFPVRAAGTNTVFNFLRSDMSARAGALAGSFLSVPDDPSSLFYNPAALGTLTAPRGTAGFLKNLMDVNAGSLAYGQSIGDLGTVAAGVLFQHYGSFTETDELGNSLGSFSASDLAVSAGFSGLLEENLYWGAAVKFVHSSIAGAASSALAGDLGILYQIPQSRIAVGASIRNLGGQLSTYLGARESLPLDASVGLSVVPKGLPLLLNLAFHKLNQDVGSFGERFRSFTVGGEFTLSRVLQLRVGYDNERRKDLNLGSTSGLTGFSTGVGITVNEYRLDYALSSLGKIGNLHRVSVSGAF